MRKFVIYISKFSNVLYTFLDDFQRIQNFVKFVIKTIGCKKGDCDNSTFASTSLNVKPHLHTRARASPLAQPFACLCLCANDEFSHVYEHSHVRTHKVNCHSSHLTRIWKSLWVRAPQMARRITQKMTRRICDWYARHLPRYSSECVNVAIELARCSEKGATVTKFNWLG